MRFKRLLVTGGAGFIGSAFIRYLLRFRDFSLKVINLDSLTYASQLPEEFQGDARYELIQEDIRNQELIESILKNKQIDVIVHFAAETHVDRSIEAARPFFETNVMGTLSLLEAVRKFPHVHFHQISTDEVFGSLSESGSFQEFSPYRPSSPYSASKAAADHLVRSFANTYGISTTISHCSNNYGPRQFPEKLIPVIIAACLANRPLPIYGRGTNVRDWLYVDDHIEAIWLILQKGKRGESYNIGGGSEIANIDLLYLIIELLSIETKINPEQYRSLIEFVPDRPGHDFRYSMDFTKLHRELGWSPKTTLRDGLIQTIGSSLFGG